MVAVLGFGQVYLDEAQTAQVPGRDGANGRAHVKRLHREPRRVARVTRVLYTAQEQQQHLDRFSRVGRSPDDTAALT